MKTISSKFFLTLFAAAILIFNLKCRKKEFEQPLPPTAPNVDFRILSNIDGTVKVIPDASLLSYDTWENWTSIFDFGDSSHLYYLSTYGDDTISHNYFYKGDYDITLRTEKNSDLSLLGEKTIRISATPFWDLLGPMPFKFNESCFFSTPSGAFAMVADDSLASSNKIWQFDPTTAKWTEKWDAPFKIHDMQASVVGEKVYFGCGRSGDFDILFNSNYRSQPVPDFWMLDATNGTWTQLPPFTAQIKDYYSMFCATDTVLYGVVNGYAPLAVPDFKLWKHTLGTNDWVYVDQTNLGSNLVALNDKIYLLSLFNTWEFEPTSKTWLDIGTSAEIEFNSFALADEANHKIHVGGGFYHVPAGIFNQGGVFNYHNYFVFDANTKTWGQPIPLPWKYPSDAFSGGFLFDNKLYIVSDKNEVWKYAR